MEYLRLVNCLDLCDSSSSSSDDISSDEELMDILNAYNCLPNAPQKKKTYVRENMLTKYDDSEFERRFRLPKDMVINLAEQLEPRVQFLSKRNNPISTINQILITLRYYATASFQIVSGDLFGISQPTVSRIILRISKEIARFADEEIKFPDSSLGLRKLKEDFYAIRGIPQVIGIIDGTHIPIQSVGGRNPESFRNRKGFFSINTQIVCDANMRILDINARWPGSCHDQMIFTFSKLHARLEAGEFCDALLLGDSGYACRNYLITPLLNPTSNAEIAFNNSFVKTRRLVEQTIGIWKRRFPVLSTKIRLNIQTALIVIVATAVLHNKLKQRPVPEPEILMDDYDIPSERINETYQSDFDKRTEIINNFF